MLCDVRQWDPIHAHVGSENKGLHPEVAVLGTSTRVRAGGQVGLKDRITPPRAVQDYGGDECLEACFAVEFCSLTHLSVVPAFLFFSVTEFFFQSSIPPIQNGTLVTIQPFQQH